MNISPITLVSVRHITSLPTKENGEISILLSGLLPAHVGLYVKVDIHVVPQQIIGCEAFSTLVAFERFVLLGSVDSPHVLLQVLHLDHHPH